MKIYILCNDGSPLGITYQDIFGKNGRIGVGGAELAMMTLAEGWTKAGHEVVLFNNPSRFNESPFEQRNISDFERDTKCDVLVVFRSPNQKIVHAQGLKVWFSTDQCTTGNFSHFSKLVDKVVTISPYHSRYFDRTYQIQESIPIDLPVRTWDYEQSIEKVPNRLIFTSVPDRGLQLVAETLPRIKEQIPNVSIVITSDYRLWGVASPMNSQYVQMFLSMKDVEFLGAIPRERLVQEQLKAQIHYYPSTYEELFCIAVAESMVAGVLPITTNVGALETTNMGILIQNPNKEIEKQILVQTTVEYLNNPRLCEIQKDVQRKALERFGLTNILEQWNKKVFNG